MARDTVLVIGAGASYGARMSKPREHRPPLGRDLASYLLGWYDENAPRAEHFEAWNMAMEDETNESAPSDELYEFAAEVRAVLAEAVALCTPDNPLGFEQVMAKLLLDGEDNRHVLTKLNSVIAVSFLGGKKCSLGREEDAYDKLFDRMKDGLRSVITPNYDLLCEEALKRVGLTFQYAGAPGARDEQVVIYKFHGSANFFQTPGGSGGSSEEIARRGVKPLTATEQKKIRSFSNAHPLGVSYPRENAFLEHKHKGGASYPVMVTYGPGKDATDGRHYLDEIRTACDENLRQDVPARIIALGVSPPRGDGDDDAWEELCHAFKSLDCAKEYWSKNEDERTRMAFYGFKGRDGYFDELLEAPQCAVPLSR
jgi:hypothetical protein